MRTHESSTAPTPPAPPRVSLLRPDLAGLRLSAVLLAVLAAVPALLAAAPAQAATSGVAPGPTPRTAEAPRLEVPAPRPAPRLDIRRRSGLAPADQASMDAWFLRYRRGAAPVKKALAELLEARRLYRPHQLGPECRALHSRVRRFLSTADDQGLFPLRDTAADYHLRHLYRHLEAAAAACLSGRWAASDAHLRRAGRAFRQARLALGRWSLTP